MKDKAQGRIKVKTKTVPLNDPREGRFEIRGSSTVWRDDYRTATQQAWLEVARGCRRVTITHHLGG